MALFFTLDEKQRATDLLPDNLEGINPDLTPADAALELLYRAETALADEWERAQWEAHCREQTGPLQPRDFGY